MREGSSLPPGLTTPLIAQHFRTSAIQYEIAKACTHREVACIGESFKIRPMKIFRVRDVEFWLGRIRPWVDLGDFYMSVAIVDLPKLPSSSKDFPAAQAALRRSWDRRIRGWSWFMDLDVQDAVRDFDDARRYACDATERARELGYNAYPVFSGTGWNVRVDSFPGGPGEQELLAVGVAAAVGIPDKADVKNRVERPRVVADTGIYDKRRIYRVPFTVSRKSGLVVTPMTLEEAREAVVEDFRVDGYCDRWLVRDRLAAVAADAHASIVEA